MTATVENAAETAGTSAGRVARVIGPVVDVEFPAESMPEIYFALHVDITYGGDTRTLTLEVEQHLGDNLVRAISLEATDGLIRGADLGPGRRRHQGPRVQRARRPARRAQGEPQHHRALADPPARAAA